MPLREQLNEDLRSALRAGDELRKATIRLLLTAIRNAEIPPERDVSADESLPAGPRRIELSDERVLDLVRREVKQRRDAIEFFQKANRGDLTAKAEAEIALLSAYLPPQMSREEIDAVARRIIDQVGARGAADKGRVMPLIITELRGKAEGGQINASVTQLLSGSS